MRHIRILRLLGALFFLAASATYVLAQSPSPSVSYPASFAVSPPLSDLQGSGPAMTLKIHARRPLPHRAAVNGQDHASDKALQTVAGSRLSTQEQPNFPGLGENGSIPPDPNIAVGPNHIVQVVNIDIAIFDKSGNVLSGPKRLSSLWSALGGPCATNNAGDPVVQYDRLADRFIVTQLGSLSSPYSECIAVSKTSDPTGAYYLYSYSFGTDLNDYQKFSVWPTATNAAYLATYNIFANGASFAGSKLCAYDRTAMLSGAASPTQICFTISLDGGFLPSDLDGPTAPLDHTPGLFVNFETLSSLRMYKLSPNFAIPNNSALSAPTDIPVASFNEACSGGTCIPQPNTGRTLDSLGDRLMYRLAYRNFGDHESIVVNHSVTAGSSVGVRWYELRQTPPSTAAIFGVYQQSTFAQDSAYRWMGSIAMDQAGDVALGYSESSSSLFPSINYTGRMPTEALGTMESENTLQSGGGSQTGYTRWGDYTAMRIDPSDDCTFWYTDEYYTATSSFVWSTAIGSFKFLNCAGTADFSMSSSATPLTFTAGGGGTSNGTVTVTSVNGFSSPVSLTTSGACGGATGITCALGSSSVTPSANSSASTSLTISVPSTTSPGSYPITIKGTSGALSHSTTLTVVVSAPAVNFTISASPPSITVNRGSSGSYTVSLGASGGSSSVSLSVSGLPARTSATFSPNPATAPVSSTLTISVNRKARPGPYTLTISGNNGSFSHSTSVGLTIQ